MDFIEAIETELGVTAEKNLLPMQPGDVRDGVRHVPTGTCRQSGSLWGGAGSFTVFEAGGPGPDGE